LLGPVGNCDRVCGYFYLGASMKARVRWVENALFLAESGSGHAVVMDGPPESGGRNLGVRPMEMLLMGMGGCTAFDVVHILRKGRHDVRDCELQLEADRAESDPKVFTRIHVHFVVKGKGLNDTVVNRAVQLSAEKYCSASIMLGKTAQITHDYEIVEVE
jgi:putative redox protein